MDVSPEELTHAAGIVAEARAAGLTLELDGHGGLACTGRTEAMTPELATRIDANLAAVAALLVRSADQDAMVRLDEKLGVDRWGAEFDPEADLPPAQPPLANATSGPTLSADGRSWWCPCGANVVVGWPRCPYCGVEGGVR